MNKLCVSHSLFVALVAVLASCVNELFQILRQKMVLFILFSVSPTTDSSGLVTQCDCLRKYIGTLIVRLEEFGNPRKLQKLGSLELNMHARKSYQII